MSKSLKEFNKNRFYLIVGDDLTFRGELQEDVKHGIDDGGRLATELFRLMTLKDVQKRGHGSAANAWKGKFKFDQFLSG